MISTNFFVNNDIKRLTDLKYAPAIFQEFIDGINLRITYIDGKIFPAEVKVSIPEANRDWRVEGYNQVSLYNLSETHQLCIQNFMKEMHLDYGALDFKLDAKGNLVFLEVNPGGQYLFIEIQIGLPISKAIAESLI